jgi:type IV pilus assembly protein PilW
MFIKRQSGLSLIELMIGLLVGAVVVAGALKTFAGSAKNSEDTLNVSTLNQDLRAMMDIMVRDIRRAGYVASPVITDTTAFLNSIRHNPFANIKIEADGSCITYLYNKDSVNPNSVEDSERWGFKKVKDTTFSPPKTVLRMRRSSPDLACNSGTWESITSSAVEVTDLRFTLEEIPLNVSRKQSNPASAVEIGCNRGDKCLFVRKVTIRLSGALNEDATVMQTLTETVRLRNDYYCTIGSLNPRVCI